MDAASSARADRNPAVQSQPSEEAILDQVISEEMGEHVAELMRRTREAAETWRRQVNPDEGLRERKRRLTRQLISDAATAMFATRGFDHVTVAEVADRVGVSEKTVYNYFPSKESLVLDNADETIERLAAALRERRPGESLTEAVVRAIKDDMARFEQAPDELIAFTPTFAEMIKSQPALRAAWLEIHNRLAAVATEELAALAEVGACEPEPMIAGRALAGLVDVANESRERHISAGLRREALSTAVAVDLDRAARLLETGLWSFSLMARGAQAGRQAREAARAAAQARDQVVAALRQAHAAWAQVRRQGHAAHATIHRRGRP